MTPGNKIRREILLQAAADPELDFGLPLDTDEQVAAAYEKLVEADAHWDWEAVYRCGEVETGLPCESSRHYESKSVATKLSDGSWVGWTFWFGGGKHGEPQEIAWMEDAYDLICTEVVVRTFTRTDGK